MTMVMFGTIFPEVANEETRVISAFADPIVPSGDYALVEAFCVEHACDCRRVMINVIDVERREQVATINYAFEPPRPPYEDEGQMFLDPLNPQSDLSARFLALFENIVGTDPAYRVRLERHYAMWKSVIDDPEHPEGSVRRARTPVVPGKGFLPARQPVRRDGPKVGPNASCPCGSGKKHKRCCRRELGEGRSR